MAEEGKKNPENITDFQQFEALFNYASIGIVITNHTGQIINFNKYAELQFGYSKQEIVDKNVEILIPGQFQSSHVKRRNNFYQHPEPRRMGEGRDLFALKKNGTQFPAEVSLSFYAINGEMYVIAFVIDIMVRKENEMTVLQQKSELENITEEMKRLNIQLEEKVEVPHQNVTGNHE